MEFSKKTELCGQCPTNQTEMDLPSELPTFLYQNTLFTHQNNLESQIGVIVFQVKPTKLKDFIFRIPQESWSRSVLIKAQSEGLYQSTKHCQYMISLLVHLEIQSESRVVPEFESINYFHHQEDLAADVYIVFSDIVNSYMV